ncbi:hypothetical protein SDJN03_22861, partial [Cucurbita argyrosperma subsp. sororia]
MPERWSGRVWPRQGCCFDPNTGRGDCAGLLHCRGTVGGDDIGDSKIINALIQRESGGRIHRSRNNDSYRRRRWVRGCGMCGESEQVLPVRVEYENNVR